MPKENVSLDALVEALTLAMNNSKNNVTQDDLKGAASAATRINELTQKRLDQQRAYACRISDEMTKGINCRWVTVERIYAEYQPKFTISINGCTICIKADGKPVYIHNDYATILFRRLKALNEKIELMRKGAYDKAELPRY